MGLDYEEAGVDIEKEEEAIRALTKHANYSRKDNYKKIDLDNHYAGIIELGPEKLAMSTDGVGTKLLVAEEMEKYDDLGIDCIAMNANDVLSVGAEPIGFLDYLAFEEPNVEVSRQIGHGLKKGAKKANLNLMGGETATLTEVINGFDLAGSCVGITDELVLGRKIEVGDVVIGIKSNGVHSNGLTLARKAIHQSEYTFHDKFNNKNKIGEELLKPTEIYVEPVLRLINQREVHGLSHITGGGLRNLMRLGKHSFNINNPIMPQEIFSFIQNCGEVSKKEMYRVFNMGVGYCVIIPESEKRATLNDLKDMGYESKVIGNVQKGSKVAIKTKDQEIVL